MQIWMSFVGSVAVLAIIGIAFCLMVRLISTSECITYVAVTLGITMILILLPGVLKGLWGALTGMQRAAVITIAFVLVLRQTKERTKSKG